MSESQVHQRVKFWSLVTIIRTDDDRFEVKTRFGAGRPKGQTKFCAGDGRSLTSLYESFPGLSAMASKTLVSIRKLKLVLDRKVLRLTSVLWMKGPLSPFDVGLAIVDYCSLSTLNLQFQLSPLGTDI